ncbi:hypothetical protein KP509_11G043300 [Ceratopteris richardii]|uniref:Uncharacterized protein n=1 Tax=Ceratopteris richardii TaxID=49495 RepID=A0A8T2TP78_CERRI|nr:hypothetical protein KP509_11G043300 [Ceratopteris richardii]
MQDSTITITKVRLSSEEHEEDYIVSTRFQHPRKFESEYSKTGCSHRRRASLKEIKRILHVRGGHKDILLARKDQYRGKGFLRGAEVQSISITKK